MATTAQPVAEVCAAARRASRALARLDTNTKNAALHAMADALERRTLEILDANAHDMEAGEEAGLHAGLLDRLALSEERLAGMASDVRTIAAPARSGGRDDRGLAATERARHPPRAGAARRGGGGLRGAPERDRRLLGAVPEVGQRDRAARLVDRGALERGARPGGRDGRGRSGRARGRDLDRLRRRPRRAAPDRHPGRRGGPDHPARRRGPEGRAQGARHRARDVRGGRQLPRLRGRERRPRRAPWRSP